MAGKWKGGLSETFRLQVRKDEEKKCKKRKTSGVCSDASTFFNEGVRNDFFEEGGTDLMEKQTGGKAIDHQKIFRGKPPIILK